MNENLNFIITVHYAKGKVLSTALEENPSGGCLCRFEAAVRDLKLEESLEAWVEAYGNRCWPTLDDIPLAWEYLPTFSREALQQVAAIPPGEAHTYKQVAVDLGRPTAARAVGGACGRNPFPLLIPCHRVIDTNRKMRGYSAGNGVILKEALLSHEGFLVRR